MYHQPIHHDDIATPNHEGRVTFRRRNRPNAVATDGLVMTSMFRFNPTVGHLRARVGILKELNAIQQRLGRGESANQLAAIALLNRVPPDTIDRWKNCLRQPHEHKDKLRRSIHEEQTARETLAHRRELGKRVQGLLGQREMFVSDCGTKFSVKKFTDSTQVHVGPDVPVHLSYEETEEYNLCTLDTYMVNVVKLWLKEPGVAELPCTTTSDKVHQVIRVILEEDVSYSDPLREDDLLAPRQILRSQWEHVHRSPDE